MRKRFIATALLITTAGSLLGCGAKGNNNIQETTLVNAQQNLNNEQIDLQTQEKVEENLQTQNKRQSEMQNQDSNQNNSQLQVSISMEKAKKLVLDRVSGATENDVWIELDYDDGNYVYEGEIFYKQTEYEFEIDANTGRFLEWSEERR